MAKPATVKTEDQIVAGTTNSIPAQTGGDILIRRMTYSTSASSAQALAGQAIAVRVTGDPVAANNGLFYLHSDHLGSTSAMSDVNGNLVPDSVARYTPFGDWRTEPAAGLTDRGYTGHAHNNLSGGDGANDLGLIYMNARYYVPNTNRFLSADSIVPDPTNPQSFNRYSYVLNNPLRYTDPTGHLSEDEIEDYFGYGEDEALDAWGQELFDLLWDTELAWRDVFNYDGNNTMLALFEVGDDQYRGGFWGLDGDNRGEKVQEYQLKNSDDIDYNPRLSEDYRRFGWENLPRQTRSDGRNNYDPTVYIDVVTVGTVSATASITGLCFISGPGGWIAAGITIVGGGTAIYQVATDDLTHNYPVLRSPGLIGNAPQTWHAFAPRGYYD